MWQIAHSRVFDPYLISEKAPGKTAALTRMNKFKSNQTITIRERHEKLTTSAGWAKCLLFSSTKWSQRIDSLHLKFLPEPVLPTRGRKLPAPGYFWETLLACPVSCWVALRILLYGNFSMGNCICQNVGLVFWGKERSTHYHPRQGTHRYTPALTLTLA